MIKEEIIGTKISIEYFDQNEEFANILPRSGLITQKLKSSDSIDNWFVIDLDEPFEYQMKIGEPFQFKLLHCNKLLIRSRWEGKEIGGNEDTSIFIFLITDETLLDNGIINIDNFYHIAWGMSKTIKI